MSTTMDVASGISDERLQRVEKQAKSSLVGSFLNFPTPILKTRSALSIRARISVRRLIPMRRHCFSAARWTADLREIAG